MRRAPTRLTPGRLAAVPFLLAAAGLMLVGRAAEPPALPRIPDRTFVLTDYGAVGDGHTLNTAAFSRAIRAVDRVGGGRLVVPRGVFVTGPIRLCSRLDLHLDDGAVIAAPESFAELGLPDPAGFANQAEADRGFASPEPLITGERLTDVALSGPGAIDGRGAHWWAWSERAARNAAQAGHPGRISIRRPNLIVIHHCTRLHVTGVTLRNSPKFHLAARDIDDLTIDHVTVRAPWDGSAPNTDALDPGPGHNFWIHHCEIDTGDDDIVIKSGGTGILIEDNVIRHGHGISIGSETTAGVDGMLVRRCTFEGTQTGLRIKSMRGAGGLVRNVRYEDITMRDVERAFVVQLDYMDNNRPDFHGDPAKTPAVRDIVFERISVANAREAGIIHGLPESEITGLVFRDVTLAAGRDFDIRHAAAPIFERVTRDIRPGTGPAPIPGEH